MSLCDIDGCTQKVNARGWCSTHYQRWRRHGDPCFRPVRPPVVAPTAEELLAEMEAALERLRTIVREAS